MREPPFASVVVPTWNRAPLLADCLASLRAQDHPAARFEIVVIDDGSTDDTEAVTRAARGPRYLRVGHGGLNAARNAGIAATRGDPICFVDDDALAPPGWLGALVDAAARRPDAGCLGGSVRLRFEATPPRICEMESWLWEAEVDYGVDERAVAHLNGCNLAVRRWALDAVGAFDASLPLYGDETEWEDRLHERGIPLLHVPGAWIWHRRTAADLAWRTLLRRRFRQGAGYAVYARRRGERISYRRTLGPVPFYLAHALRRRCFGALMEVARKLGITWGTLCVPGRHGAPSAAPNEPSR